MTESLAWDALPILLDGLDTQIRGIESQGFVVAIIRMRAGADARPAFRGLENDCCQIPHWGYVVRGRLTVWLEDGTSAHVEQGEVFTWPPGHAPACDVDTEYVEISPAEPYRALMAHVGHQGAPT